MPGTVRLEAISGPIAGKIFRFEEHDTFLFGRAGECHARLPAGDATASRHHFILEVNPPAARLRDLGSRNGTYVNGTKYIGRRDDIHATGATGPDCAAVDLRDGDCIQVGETRFAVRIESPEPLLEHTGAARPPTGAGPANETSPAAIGGYEILQRLGGGNMGAVYRARSVVSGTSVAVKVLLAAHAVDAQARQEFLREIAVLATLRHPHLIELLDHGSSGDVFYFVTEICEGGDLEQLSASRGGRLTPAEALPPVVQATEGLAFAHAQGFVHRDLKPPNILLADAGGRVAKVADFGLAKSFEKAGLSGMTATGTVGGTLHFMPREQITDFKRVQPASDVWSLGATLYALLTGVGPRDFPAETDPLQVVLQAPIVPIRQRDVALPAALAAVIDRALAVNPADRYRTAMEFRDALGSV